MSKNKILSLIAILSGLAFPPALVLLGARAKDPTSKLYFHQWPWSVFRSSIGLHMNPAVPEPCEEDSDLSSMLQLKVKVNIEPQPAHVDTTDVQDASPSWNRSYRSPNATMEISTMLGFAARNHTYPTTGNETEVTNETRASLLQNKMYFSGVVTNSQSEEHVVSSISGQFEASGKTRKHFERSFDGRHDTSHGLPASMLSATGVKTAILSSETFRWPQFLCIAMPVMAALILASLIIGKSHRGADRSDAERAAITSNLLLCLQHLTYSLVIPYSYSLSAAIGESTVFSGMLIGTHMAGVFLGSAVSWVLFQIYVDLWMYGRTLQLCANCCNLCGAVIYFTVSLAAENAALTHGNIIPGSAILLILARIADGLGTGIVVHFSLTSLAYMFPEEQQVGRTVDNSYAVLLGLGLGPLLSSAAVSLCDSPKHLCTIGSVYVGVAAAVLIVCHVHFPHGPFNLESTEGKVSSSQSPRPFEATIDRQFLTQNDNVSLLLAGLALTCARGFGISGMQSAIAFLLEDKYYFSKGEIGIVIAAGFLLLLPVRSIYSRLQTCMSNSGWIRTFVSITAFGALMLYTGVADITGLPNAVCLVLACAIMSPFYVMTDAIVTGVMIQHALPAGSWLDASYLMLWRGASLSLIGGNLGPPMARYSAELGQDSFAMQQLMAVAIIALLLEAIIHPSLGRKSAAKLGESASKGFWHMSKMIRIVTP